MNVRLPLPEGCPMVEVPRDLADSLTLTLTPYCGLPGAEVWVTLPNGYGLGLIHGRGYSGENTFEAYVMCYDGAPANWDYAADTGVRTDAGPSLASWVDATWVRDSLAALAALPPRD